MSETNVLMVHEQHEFGCVVCGQRLDAIDVDRLDQAWRNVMTRGDFGTFVAKAHWHDVAAEYARLASPTPATPEVE